MNDQIFDIITLLIPVTGAIFTGFIIPYIRTKLSAARMDEITKWIAKAVEAPHSGTEKREYVIQFIDRMFNAKKEIITRDQIRILLEASLSQIKRKQDKCNR